MNTEKSKSEFRGPNSEIDPKAELRTECSQIDSRPRSLFGIRNSNFLRISAFGFRISAALLLISALLPACSKKSVGPNVLARVGAREITVEDFERELQWYEKSRRPMPDREALLEQMISRELRLQKAKASGLENDPDVRRRYEAILAGRVDDLQLKPQLEQLTVSPEEISAAFQKEIAHYSRPAKVRLALICIKTDRKATAEKISEAGTRIAEARKAALSLPIGTKGLGAAAADYSEDQASRYRGGDVGWFDQNRTEYRWPAEVVAAGFALQKNGDVSDVIKAADGLYIVSKTDSRDPVVTPLEQVQNSIQRRLLAEKRQQAEASFNQAIRAFAPVETFSHSLAKVHYPSPTSPKGGEPKPPGLQGITLSSNGQSAAN